MKTLLLALIGKDNSQGTREGAVRGLMGIGKEAIRQGVVEGGGAKVIGEECAYGMNDQAQVALIDSVMVSEAAIDKANAQQHRGRLPCVSSVPPPITLRHWTLRISPMPKSSNGCRILWAISLRNVWQGTGNGPSVSCRKAGKGRYHPTCGSHRHSSSCTLYDRMAIVDSVDSSPTGDIFLQQ